MHAITGEVMLNLLESDFLTYLKDNLVLTIILGVVILLIIALVITMIVLAVKHKKHKNSETYVQVTSNGPELWEIEEDEPFSTKNSEVVSLDEEDSTYVGPDEHTVSEPSPVYSLPAAEAEIPPIEEETENAPIQEETTAAAQPDFAGTIFEVTDEEPEEAPKKKPLPKKKPAAKTAEKKPEPAQTKPQDAGAPAKVEEKKPEQKPASKPTAKKETQPKKVAAEKKEPAIKKDPAKKAEPKTTAAKPVKTAEAAKKTPVKKAEPKPATAKPAPKKSNSNSPYSGKWVIENPEKSKFLFKLYASNGELMLTSGIYASLASAKSGIETYKKNIENGKFDIIQTKTGDPSPDPTLVPWSHPSFG